MARPAHHAGSHRTDGALRGSGLTPLMRAAKDGHSNAVRFLLEANAAVSAEDEDGMQPIHFAAAAGCRESCETLLAARANPSCLDDFGRDALACLPHHCTVNRATMRDWEELLR